MNEAEVDARTIARHGIIRDWPDREVVEEIVERLQFTPDEAFEVVANQRRLSQEQQIQQAHDEMAYDAISHTE